MIAEPVVNAGHERLLVLALLVAGDNVCRAFENRSNEARNVLRLVLKICRIETSTPPREFK